ncbi:hypothetical protein BB934_45360 (plasmid) [Microvirga ossetica]|uniref:Uncharacterized protein n=2 Tax=Microvirga ossetica TaxID=1882682 RepID=A0A1B2EZN3_9HYPH|nr:hypothetical protein BB934_45360 [Microvirga ossetica]
MATGLVKGKMPAKDGKRLYLVLWAVNPDFQGDVTTRVYLDSRAREFRIDAGKGLSRDFSEALFEIGLTARAFGIVTEERDDDLTVRIQ